MALPVSPGGAAATIMAGSPQLLQLSPGVTVEAALVRVLNGRAWLPDGKAPEHELGPLPNVQPRPPGEPASLTIRQPVPIAVVSMPWPCCTQYIR